VVSVGVLGGTFDPIHNGHITIAEEVRRRLDLSYVIFIPAGQPWLKSQFPVTAATDRLEMVRLAIAPYPYFKLSRIEVDRQGPSYTVATLDQLQTELGAGNQLFFIMGWDTITQLPRWHEVSRLVKQCELVVIPRPDYPVPNLECLNQEIPGIAEHIILLDSPRLDISATDIRDRVARGQSISNLVPEVVEGYIKEKRLYQRS
jgi:nicotinate-nucleotide adenylyltransferase